MGCWSSFSKCLFKPSTVSTSASSEPRARRANAAAQNQPGFVGWFCPEQGCGAELRTAAGCAAHIGIHRGYSFRCGECGATFPRKNSLMQHLWQHLPPRFVCEVCGQAFKQKKDVKLHVAAAHDGVRVRFACQHEGCPSTFASISNRNRHQRLYH